MIPLRLAREYVHQLDHAGERERLANALTCIPMHSVLFGGETRYEVLRFWSTTEPAEIAAAFRASVEVWVRVEQPQPTHHAVALQMVMQLLYAVGSWSEADTLQRKRLELLKDLGDRRGESAALSLLSSLAVNLNRMNEAEALAREAEAIARELGDRSGIARAVGTRGVVHADRGEYEEALACYAEMEAVARELEDRPTIAYAVGSRGLVHAYRGEYDEALACYSDWESIAWELGDRSGIARTVANRGNIHLYRGEYDEALACYAKLEVFARELGDRPSIAHAVGGCGGVHLSRGEYDQALACFAEEGAIARELGDQRRIAEAAGNRGLVHSVLGECGEASACYAEQEAIARALNDRRSIATAVGNRGDVHRLRGEYDSALACFRQAAAEHRAIGIPYGLTYWLAGTARVLLELVDRDGVMPAYLPGHVAGATDTTWRAVSLHVAREHAAECVAISEELSKPDTLHSCRVLLTRVDAAEGNVVGAVAALEQMLALATGPTPAGGVAGHPSGGGVEQRADLHYWLWKFSAAVDHRAEALRLYEELVARMPKHEYRKRIEELRAL